MNTLLDMTQRIDIAEKQLERLLEWIPILDTKFNIILGIELAMLGLLASFAPPFKVWEWHTYILTVLTLFFLLKSLLSFYIANNPHLDGPSDSLIFFESVARLSKDLYRTMFYRQTQQEYLTDILTQCHINSLIISKKFQLLKVAYNNLLLSALFWVILIVLFRCSSPQT